MKKYIAAAVSALSLAGFSAESYARDDALFLSIDSAMQSSDFKSKLNSGVKFYFGGQAYPSPKSVKQEVVANRKTNAFGKSDQRACDWVLLSALIALQERALAEGGNAVVDITSYYKKNEYSSETKYECHAGSIMAGVALKGRIVTLP